MSRHIASTIIFALLFALGQDQVGAGCGNPPSAAGMALSTGTLGQLYVKPPFIHISKFRKKKGNNVIVLKVFVCGKKPTDGHATVTSCVGSSEKKNMGNVTGAEIKIVDKHGKITYAAVKNYDDMDNRYKGYLDLQFSSAFLELNSSYNVSLTVSTSTGSTSHSDVTLKTPR